MDNQQRNHQEEIWKLVKDIPRFEVSNKGRVRYFKSKALKYVKVDKAGYVTGQYKLEGKIKTFKVHRLVAEAFNLNPENKREVNHIDGDKTNNYPSNLEWVTRSENVKHAYSSGLKSNKGSLNPRAKLTENIVEAICSWFDESPKNTPKLACDVFGISMQQSTKIRARISWTHISCKYSFKPLVRRSTTIESTQQWKRVE